jgi:ATP-dependent Clp protease adaptor protein ClpS
VESILANQKQKLQRPPLWAAIFLNDDYTPMDFVVAVLMQVFNKAPDEAVNIMMKVHREGRATAGVYPRDIAEMKAHHAMNLAAQRTFPLMIVTEPAD